MTRSATTTDKRTHSGSMDLLIEGVSEDKVAFKQKSSKFEMLAVVNEMCSLTDIPS